MAEKLRFMPDQNPEEYKRFEKYADANVYHVSIEPDFSRLVVWSTDVTDTLLNLVKSMSESLFILYVLHVSRCDQETARYQSEELRGSEVEEFLNKYADFLANDSRHDIWFHSPSDNSTVVYDRDNIIYIYGEMDKYESILSELQFSSYPEPLYLPCPHGHHYHSEYDEQEINILSEYNWRKSPLKEED
ncbi:hypothetical protein [Paenibacillus tarimensis]|uniref:hypothetical protein n=1 Tax=Paenibacillus tarimensis TaxID=416012 RepID=UPI001F30A527|nr:hypothetical protein [Paenibacillus tarimensis]MCF2945428.1 hypothetical protein [Paenibacillus tarimensis]